MIKKQIIDSSTDWYEIHGTIVGWREQWGVLVPELGKSYAADAGIAFRKWNFKIFKIIFVDVGVALGLESNHTCKYSSPEYRLFSMAHGWKYKDDRSFYRLRDLQETIDAALIKEAEFERNHPLRK